MQYNKQSESRSKEWDTVNQLEKIKYQLIEKSIVALEETLRNIASLDVEGAIEMYNTVLAAFESLQETPGNYQEDEVIEEYLEELEIEHKAIVEVFEAGLIEELTSLIMNEIIERYGAMRDYFAEKEAVSEQGMNIKNIFYKKFNEVGLLEKRNQEVVDEVQAYWEKYGDKLINPTTHLAYYNLTGQIEPQIIPQQEFNQDIWLMLNNKQFFQFYEDKNVYDLLIDAKHAPDTLLKRVNGQYFDSENYTISRGEAFRLLTRLREDLIVKASLENDGKSVEKIHYRGHALYFKNKRVDLTFIEKRWGGDFIIQRVIRQHQMMAAPHEHSVNTFRMVTLRWNNEIHYLMTYARFGSNEEVKDNGGEGGIVISVSPEGEINNWGMADDGTVYYTHPTTGFDFNNFEQVPNFNEYIDYVKKLHNRILHHDYVSWDIAMGVNGEPIFIEMNFRGPIWKYQFVTEQPIFGEFTESILAKAVERRERIEEHQRKAQGKQQKLQEEQAKKSTKK